MEQKLGLKNHIAIEDSLEEIKLKSCIKTDSNCNKRFIASQQKWPLYEQDEDVDLVICYAVSIIASGLPEAEIDGEGKQKFILSLFYFLSSARFLL